MLSWSPWNVPVPSVKEQVGGCARAPQSVQSEPSGHEKNSAPGPPSSQSLSDAYGHDSAHPGVLAGLREGAGAAPPPPGGGEGG
eukprot:6623489-Prymnesium_polylepis.1